MDPIGQLGRLPTASEVFPLTSPCHSAACARMEGQLCAQVHIIVLTPWILCLHIYGLFCMRVVLSARALKC
jgi:hypothetical protein